MKTIHCSRQGISPLRSSTQPARPIIRCCASPDALHSRRATSPALARRLAAKGYRAEHVADQNLQAASDTAIWDFAVHAAAVIVTKDEDFAQRKTLSDKGPTVIWIRLPNTRRRDLLAWFETVMPDILAALERDETLIEVI